MLSLVAVFFFLPSQIYQFGLLKNIWDLHTLQKHLNTSCPSNSTAKTQETATSN